MFVGWDDLEIFMVSEVSSDWVKIFIMFFGSSFEGFVF